MPSSHLTCFLNIDASNSLLRTSVADLEKLARENCGANLYAQSRSGAKKVNFAWLFYL